MDDNSRLNVIAQTLRTCLPHLIEHTCSRIFENQPAYEGVSPESLAESISRNLQIAVRSLEERTAPKPHELEEAVITTLERMEVGISIEQIVLAFRASISDIHEEFVMLSADELTAQELIEGSRILWEVGDAFVARVVSTFHTETVRRQVSDEERKRTLLKELMKGTKRERSYWKALHVSWNSQYAAVMFTYDREGSVPVIQQKLITTGSEAGARALISVESGIGFGLVSRLPEAPEGVCLAVGPFVSLDSIGSSYLIAERLIKTAPILRQDGLLTLGKAGWRLSLAEDPIVAQLYEDRFLKPFSVDGGSGREILETAQAWLNNGRNIAQTAEALYVHKNTVRYRLERLTEITGFNPANIDDLLGLSWVTQSIK